MRKYLMLAIVVLGLSLALTACGGNGPSTNLRVDMVEFMFEPGDYSIPAGQEITIELSNNGAVLHEFVIMKYGTEVGQDFGPEDEENIYWEAEVDPGSSNTFTFTAPSQSGEYQVVCGTEGHFLAGMVAKLFVVAE